MSQAVASPPRSSSGRLRRLALRPEAGALVGMIVVLSVVGLWTANRGFFSATGLSTILSTASHIGIVAVPITMLLIGGEFDLSVGGMMSMTTMLLAFLLATGTPFWQSVIVVLIIGLIVGLVHAFLVVRLRFSSFIVTLASGYVLFGIGNLLYSLDFVRVVPLTTAVEPSLLVTILSSKVFGLPASAIWWLSITAVAAYVVSQTSFGNWMYATGSSAHLARATGTPAHRVKTVLFITSSLLATFLAALNVAEFKSANPATGSGAEFEAVVAAALGGGLLSGGYGSPIGTLFGIVALASVRQGTFFAQIDVQWYYSALGLLLLSIVIVNDAVRRRALSIRR